MIIKCKKCGSNFDPASECLIFGKTAFDYCYPCIFIIPNHEDATIQKSTPLKTGGKTEKVDTK